MTTITPIKLICFDVDGTITTGNDSVWQSITKGLGLDYQLHKNILQKMQDGLITVQGAIDELAKLWRSSGKASKSNITELLGDVEIRPDAFEVIKKLKEKYSVVLLSGTVNIFLEIISGKVQVDKAYTSTKFIWDGSDDLETFVYSDSQAMAKLELYNQLLNEFNLKPEETVIVGNGNNDVEVFKIAGMSFAMEDNSPQELKTLATHTINSLTELLWYL